MTSTKVLGNVINDAFAYFSRCDHKLTHNEMLNVIFLESMIFQKEKKYVGKYMQQHVLYVTKIKLTEDIRLSFISNYLGQKEKKKILSSEGTYLLEYIKQKRYSEATYTLVTLALEIWNTFGVTESESEVGVKLLVFTDALNFCLTDLTPIRLNLNHYCVEAAKCKLYFLTHYILSISLWGLKPCNSYHPCYQFVIMCFKFLLRAWKILALYPRQNRELIFEIYFIYLIIAKDSALKPGTNLQKVIDVSQLTLASYLKEIQISMSMKTKASKKETKKEEKELFSWQKFKKTHQDYHTAILALFVICYQNQKSSLN